MSFNVKSIKNDAQSNKFTKRKLCNTKISYEPFSKPGKSYITTDYVDGKCPNSSIISSSDLRSFDEDSNESLPEIAGWRRAITEDKPAIKQLQKLTGDIANLLYRKRNIDDLIEKSCFPIVLLDSNGDLISFTAYDPFPNIPAVPSFFWNEWLQNNYRLIGACPRNVLFVHYMVWQPQQADKFLRLLLEISFREFLHLKHIILVKPPKTNVPDFYAEFFIPVLPLGLEKLDYDSIQSLLVCLRSSVVRPLHIRTAFEEEFDIIVPVVTKNMKDAEKPSVVEIFDFLHESGKKTLICESDGQLVGVMIVNVQVDLEALAEAFDLGPFHGLRKRDSDKDEEHVEREVLSVPKHSSLWMQERANVLISSDFLFDHMNWELTLNKIKTAESLPKVIDSSDTLSADSDFSHISSTFFRWSSLIDIEGTSQEQNESLGDLKYNDDSVTALGEFQVSVHTSIGSTPHFSAPKYHGYSNAFVIDLFAVDCSKVDQKITSFDFLEAAFKIVPDKDYCLLIIPTDLMTVPLLDFFVRVIPRPKSNYKQELYLCHKNSLLANCMTVRNTEKEDLVNIINFLKNVDGSDFIYEDIVKNCFDEESNFRSFVLTVEDKIVGVSMLDHQSYFEEFHMYFHVNDYIRSELNKYDNQSVVKHLILNPIYNIHARFFIQDMMRLADLTCLFAMFCAPMENEISLVTVLEEFAPVRPKIKVGLNEQSLNVQLSGLRKNTFPMPCSLCIMNTRLCGLTKIHVNFVIVVVGASRTSIGFLETLIYGPTRHYITYNNLICVTPHVLGKEGKEKELKDLMFCHKDSFSRKYPSFISLEAYVSFIYGVMTEIKRKEKYIIVNNKMKIKYDYLILTCGLQYLSPTPKARETPKASSKIYGSSLSRFLPNNESQKINFPIHPNNMFIINTTSDASAAVKALELLMQKLKNSSQIDKKIIVYGHELRAFLTIHTLLKLGIPGEFIVFVEPFPSETTSVTVFNDYSVDQAVLESIRSCKVTYYTDYFLYDWSLNSDDYITSIVFHTRCKQVMIPCLAFFPFGQKAVSTVTYNACKNAGLVYDGRLVINHNFKTNDDHIYAAGPFTKYARRYYAHHQDHQFYNSREIGQKLAQIIRWKIDPTVEDKTEEHSFLVPQMQQPLYLYCELPGDFYFFVMRKPGKELDLETAYNFYDYGEVLTTGDCLMKNGRGYFRLHLSSEGFVQSITCFTKDKIDYVNLSCLYGLHQRLLNNLLFRYDLSLIPDFFDYFRQPWALALFHEKIHLLRECNLKAFKEKFSLKCDETGIHKSVYDVVTKRLKSVQDATVQDFEADYQNSSVANEIKLNLLDFLECYKEDLPVYATPSTVSCMLFRDPLRFRMSLHAVQNFGKYKAQEIKQLPLPEPSGIRF